MAGMARMARQPGRGRPMKAPRDQLGALIVERMAELHIAPATLAKRLGMSRSTLWRLIHGRTRVLGSQSLVSLCTALEFEGERRGRFMQLVAERSGLLPEQAPELVPLQSAVLTPKGCARKPASAPGRAVASTSDADLRRLMLEQIRTIGLTIAECARLARIQPSTLSRFLRGRIRRSHVLDVATVMRVLRIEAESDQHAFLRLAAKADAFALALPVRMSSARYVASERAIGASLDEVEHEVCELRAQRLRGEVDTAFQRAEGLFRRVFGDARQAAKLAASAEWTRMKLHVGFEYCEGQAATLGWYARGVQMIETLGRMEEDLLLAFPTPQRLFASEYGHLLNLRAPLYRHDGDAPNLPSAYRQTLDELTDALEQVVPCLDEPTLHIELLRNRGHAFLLSGETGRWKADLLAAERVARNLQGDESEQYQALVEYSWGEGYKRLASGPHLSMEQARMYRREALYALHQSQIVFARYFPWRGYGLLAEIAAAQCLVAIEPGEALMRARRLRTVVQQHYPSLGNKVERVTRAAARPAGFPSTGEV